MTSAHNIVLKNAWSSFWKAEADQYPDNSQILSSFGDIFRRLNNVGVIDIRQECNTFMNYCQSSQMKDNLTMILSGFDMIRSDSMVNVLTEIGNYVGITKTATSEYNITEWIELYRFANAYLWRELFLQCKDNSKMMNDIYQIINKLVNDPEFPMMGQEVQRLLFAWRENAQVWEVPSALRGLNSVPIAKKLYQIAKDLKPIQTQQKTTGKVKKTPTPKKTQSGGESSTSKTKKKRSLTEAQKKKIAARQDFKCANQPNQENKGLDGYDCPFWKYREGRFDESGYDIDHIQELGIDGADTIDNCQALCICCHRVKTTRFNISKKK